jgi:prepilin-type N-terminal cleavage/methylation domain-containing protein
MEIHIQNRKKGFTLAELLVVVAIVAILAAISIPIFTRQLEASREATDLANVLPMQR